MPEIGDVMDVTIDELSPEQLQQLKDATDQFQMKCLMTFGKNRSSVPYLKNEMPRVLLSGESDITAVQEKEEALQAFRDTVGNTPRVLMQGRRKSRRRTPTRIPLYSY
jgi:hypothetical protein